jgi:Tfp pilus assembly protein PilW
MEFPTSGLRRNRAAFTLMELLVAAAIATAVALGAVSFYIFSIKSFAATSNYTVLNGWSRNASDMISRDVRNANGVASATTNQLTLNLESDPNPVTYTYDPAGQTLSRVQGSSSQILLQNLTSLTWSLYQTPTNTLYGSFPPAADPAVAKFVSFQWNCARPVSGAQSNSATLQTALIELRNR